MGSMFAYFISDSELPLCTHTHMYHFHPIQGDSSSNETGTSPDDFIPFSASTTPENSNGGACRPPITFDDLAVGTFITNQYATSNGVIFGGPDLGPFITTDLNNPSSPVLSGSPAFEGDIEGFFVAADGVTPTVVGSFELDVGFLDLVRSLRLQWFDRNDNLLGEAIIEGTGIHRFVAGGGNIARFHIGSISTPIDGFAIDNFVSCPAGACPKGKETMHFAGVFWCKTRCLKSHWRFFLWRRGPCPP